MKVLIIEDDSAIVEVVSLAICIRWPEVKMVTTKLGVQGVELVETEAVDVVILDLGLPDIDGFEVLKQIRLFSLVPIVVLTVMEDEADIVRALELGADEYIVKPFRQLELLSRLHAILRRRDYHVDETYLVYGPLRLDQLKRKLFYGKREINLTGTESVILYQLMRNAEQVISITRLAGAVWGTDYPAAVDAIRVYIRRLRRKIETDPSHPQLIHTQPGVGYKLKKPS